MLDNNDEGRDEMTDESVESAVSAEEETVNILYRELPEQDWPTARAILSFAYPDRPITLNPDTQRLIVAECDGTIIAAAIVSVAYHINYILPDEAVELVRLDVLQSGAESLLPDESVYYTVVPDDSNDTERLTDELSMTACPALSLYTKRKTVPITVASNIDEN